MKYGVELRSSHHLPILIVQAEYHTGDRTTTNAYIIGKKCSMTTENTMIPEVRIDGYRIEKTAY